MARMPWNRKTPSVEVQVPPEVEEYYQSTQKDRRGMAWLLAFATLLLTILIAVLIFFTGRWAYNAIFGDDSGTNSVQVEETESTEGAESSDGEASASDDAVESPLTESTENGPSQESLPSGPSAEAQAGSDGGATPGAGGSNQTPTTGPGDPEIPRTGPTEE